MFREGERLFRRFEEGEPELGVQWPVQIWKVGTASLPQKKVRGSVPDYIPDRKISVEKDVDPDRVKSVYSANMVRPKGSIEGLDLIGVNRKQTQVFESITQEEIEEGGNEGNFKAIINKVPEIRVSLGEL